MYAILGFVLVLAAVLGGFLLERGNLYVLLQPAELLIVGGAAIGIILVSNPPRVIRKMAGGMMSIFRPPTLHPDAYLRYLRMLYEVFGLVQRVGANALEAHVEQPEESEIFSRYPALLSDPETRDFVCDSLRMLVIGATTPRELDHLMDHDIDVQRRGRQEPVVALSAVADALPGLGIVAAVLGVVNTMQAIGAAPETVGQKVAAALVGTFLGIVLCYGVAGPLATRLGHLAEQHTQFLEVLRTGMVAFARGASPILAVEYARRSIPVELRPSFLELEATIRRDARIPVVPLPQGVHDAAPHDSSRTN
ncbi:MAG: flagellar motor stator protein MotA [Bryobacteraceae bacterium]|jgi:chemotaxis protein MotA